MKAKSKKRYQEHKEDRRERNKNYYQEHKEEIKENKKQDPILRLTNSLRTRIYKSLEGQLHGVKLGKTEELVDCSSMDQEKSRQRYAEDPILRLTKCVRGRIYESLKGQLHGEKLGKTEELVDCSFRPFCYSVWV